MRKTFIVAIITLALSMSRAARADDPPAAAPKPQKDVEWSAGDPVPEGQAIATRTRYDLVLGGAVLLTASYIAPYIAGAACQSSHPQKQCTSGWRVLPIAGPMVDLAVTDKLPAGSKATLVLGALGQMGGGALMVAGLMLEKKILVPIGTPVGLVPSVGPSFAGITAVGAF